MGKMSRDEVIDFLKKTNPRASMDMVTMYADSFQDYQEAAENIEKNGNIVAHPRTGSPIENPYIKVKNGAMNQLRKIKLKNVDRLWV